MIRVQNKKIQWANSILLLILYFFISTAQGQYGGGSGIPEDPFLIYTSDQMNAIGNNPNDWNRHFKLMANIDLSTLTGTSFNVIGNDYDNPFTGVFDGNEHTISHLTIRGKAFRALFGRLLVGAEVKDLGLIDVNVTGSMRYVAGLVGLKEMVLSNSDILYCCLIDKYAEFRYINLLELHHLDIILFFYYELSVQIVVTR